MGRAKKQAMAAKGGQGSQLKSNAGAAQAQLCNICKQGFHVTAKRPQLEEHVNSKHGKMAFKDCFPTFEG